MGGEKRESCERGKGRKGKCMIVGGEKVEGEKGGKNNELLLYSSSENMATSYYYSSCHYYKHTPLTSFLLYSNRGQMKSQGEQGLFKQGANEISRGGGSSCVLKT